jgi:hypothetical protein
MLSDYQEQLVMHPDVSFVGSGPVNSSSNVFNTFVVKSNWTTFALREDTFAGLRSGVSLSALQASGPDLYWVWPWDIVAFLIAVPGSFLPVLLSVPGAVYKFFDGMNNPNSTQEAARGIANNDAGTWKRFFAELGSDDVFRSLRPGQAQWCRAIGGLEPPPTHLAPINEPPLATDKPVMDRILAIAAVANLIAVAGVAALLMIAAAVDIGTAVATLFPPATPVIALMVLVFMGLVIAGFWIVVMVAIAWLADQGYLVFSGSKISDETVRLPSLRAAPA